MKEAFKKMPPTLDKFPIAGLTLKAKQRDKVASRAMALAAEEERDTFYGDMGWRIALQPRVHLPIHMEQITLGQMHLPF